MNEQVTNYVNGVFAPYEGVKSVADLQKPSNKDNKICKGV